MIERETIQAMFDMIREFKDAPFDIDQECLWSYFLIDSDPELLRTVGEALEQEGFTFVEVLGPSSEDEKDAAEGEPKEYYLQVSRVEYHTVDSLMELNDWFYQVAEHYGLAGYDGMDVGAVEEGGNT